MTGLNESRTSSRTPVRRKLGLSVHTQLELVVNIWKPVMRPYVDTYFRVQERMDRWFMTEYRGTLYQPPCRTPLGKPCSDLFAHVTMARFPYSDVRTPVRMARDLLSVDVWRTWADAFPYEGLG